MKKAIKKLPDGVTYALIVKKGEGLFSLSDCKRFFSGRKVKMDKQIEILKKCKIAISEVKKKERIKENLIKSM